MCKKMWNTALKIFVYFAIVLSIFAGIFDIFKNPARAIIWFACAFLLSFMIWKLKKMPLSLQAALSGIFYLNFFGELFLRLFYNFPLYDKILHFSGALILCFFMFYLLNETSINKKKAVILVIILTLTLCVLWEVLEHLFDTYFDTLMRGVYILKEGEDLFGLNTKTIMEQNLDTKLDMLFNIFGIILFLIIISIKFKLNKPQK